MAKASANLTISLENLQTELVGTVNAGEVLDGDVRGDMFYFKLSQRKPTGKGWHQVECRLPIGANGVTVLQQ